jgi:hypothetical protein
MENGCRLVRGMHLLPALCRNVGGTSLFGLPIHTYDGDTPTEEREGLRASTRIFFTNPDMLHASILPHHKEWGAVLQHLTCAHPPRALCAPLATATYCSISARLTRTCPNPIPTLMPPRALCTPLATAT